MDIKVYGKQVLSGEVYPSGSKNSAVALIPASLLFTQKVKLENIPEITDVARMVSIMKKLGSEIYWDKKEKVIEIENKDISFKGLDKDDLGNMRGTSLFWGPMLARLKKVKFEDLPGGCTLGLRPLSPQYKAFRDLGVVVKEASCSVEMDATKAQARRIWLTEISPTATENVVMLAVGLSGETRIIGAASEPQVQDLCNFLSKGGVNISGIGSSVLKIKGGLPNCSVAYSLLSDHNEIATFLALGAATGGKIKVHKAMPDMMVNVFNVFEKFGIKIHYEGNVAVVEAGQKVKISDEANGGTLIVRGQPWPGLPIDILPLFIPLALSAKNGQVLFHNWMYEAGLFWTSELQKLGANIIMSDPHRVVVVAGNKLCGATLEAPYIIRAVVAMVLAAMIAEGETTILDADTLYRGHPRFAENLRNLGAKIKVLKESSRKSK